MALDEPRDNDEHFDVEGIPIVIAEQDQTLLGGRGLRVEHYDGWGGSAFFVRMDGAAGCC